MSSHSPSSTILSWLDGIPLADSSPHAMSPKPSTERNILPGPETTSGKAQRSSTISEVSLESDSLTRAKGPQYTINSTYSITVLRGFILTTNPVVQSSFEEYDAPPTVKDLILDLRNISKERKHIPAALLQHKPFSKLYKGDIDTVTSPTDSWLQKLKGTQIAAEDLWEALEDFVGYAKDCEARRSHEAAWKDEVHANLLRIVLKGPWRKRHVWYLNVTHARIKTGERLLPTRVTDGRPVSPKMIDFVIVYDPPKGFLQRVIAVFRARGIPYVNQTQAPTIRASPIVVNIKTKTPKGSEEEALIQLITWSAAQFNKLQQLNPHLSNSKLLPIPLLIIHGHSWRFFLAEKQGDGSILLAGDLVLGTTQEMRGILKIAAAIERLAYWAEN